MEPKEDYEIRANMAKMHHSVKERIDNAYKNKRYIEVCWLCYACFESRVNRMLEKICSGCTKQRRTDNRHVGIRTKIECCVRLTKNNYPPFKNESVDWLNTVKGWCKERNELIHGMISLDHYNNADEKFKNLAKRGRGNIDRLYDIAKDVREYYYEAEYIPQFDEKVIKQCRCTYKCIKEED